MLEHRLRVAEVVVETGDAKSLVFERPAEFHYRPGQFLTLRVGEVARCYSLSSSPYTDDKPTVTVKRTPDGYASNWIHDNVVAGMELDVLPPGGVFSPATLDDDLVCCAAGSGITPVMSIVKSVLAAGSGNITLIYANRDENSIIFRETLTNLAAAHPTRLSVIHWLESVQGLPTTPALRALLEPFAVREAFVCGPVPFMDATATALESLEAPRIRVERFVSLVKNPWRRRTAQPAPAADKPAAVEVEMDGERHAIKLPSTSEKIVISHD